MGKTLKNLITFPIILIIALGFLIFGESPQVGTHKNSDAEMMTGSVQKIISEMERSQVLEIKIIKGTFKGETITIENDESMVVAPRVFKVKDKVMVAYLQTDYGSEYFYVAEYDRSSTLFWLFIIFVVIVTICASWQGVGSLLGLATSFLILFKFVLPQILNGASPVIMAIIGALFIIPVIFYTSHGFERKTTIAVLATILTLIITGLLATIFANWGNLTGIVSDEASFLSFETAQKIDFRGLVLAGMIISILGILNDVTISQASIVQQIKQVKEDISFGELYFRAMKVGRDHIASMVNTLILVYTGVSLPLLLLFLDRSKQFLEVINYEFLSEEIIRTLVGSIGLILAVPITTLLAVIFLSKEKDNYPQGSPNSSRPRK